MCIRSLACTRWPCLSRDICQVLDVEIKAFQKTVPHRNVPVVLVGNYAERRVENPAPDGQLVSAQTAIHTAQQCGFLKYIEVHSYNTSHINEVFRQCVRAIGASRTNNTQIGPQDYDNEYLREHQVQQPTIRSPCSPGQPVPPVNACRRCWQIM